MKATYELRTARVIALRSAVVLAIGLLSAVATAYEMGDGLSLSSANALLMEKGTELEDADLERVCTAVDLTELDLSGCSRLTDAGLAHVAQLRQLTTLDLSRCHRITAQGIESISTLPNLDSLNISSSRVDLPAAYALLAKLQTRSARQNAFPEICEPMSDTQLLSPLSDLALGEP